MVGRYGVYTLVVFTQRQDTEEQRVFRLFRCPSLHARRPIGVYEGSNHIGVEKPSDHKVTSRPVSCSRVRSMPRSEEHTSELQSLMRISYAVFCLNKKTKQNK